jgi:hypothetical protein
MLKTRALRHEFVKYFPDSMEEGVLYVSEEFATAGHLCCCGCGEEVITPLNQAQWQLIKFGVGVSLHPSVGNWKFACRSHYWIRNNRVIEAAPLSTTAIENVKRRDRRDKESYIRKVNAAAPRPSILDRIVRWFRGS